MDVYIANANKSSPCLVACMLIASSWAPKVLNNCIDSGQYLIKESVLQPINKSLATIAKSYVTKYRYKVG